MEELIGKQVMVNPLLVQDPFQKQGQVGTISHYYPQNDETFVYFPYNQTGIYSTNALLVLPSKESIVANVHEKLTALEPKSIRILMDIYKLQNLATPAAGEEALRWAISDPEVRENSIMSLEHFIAASQHHEVARAAGSRR